MSVKTATDIDANKETVSIKMRINNTIYKDDKKNYETKSFKVIETFGYNIVAMVEMLHILDLDISTLYALNSPLFINKLLWIFSRLLKVMVMTQLKENIQDCQNQVLKKYDDKATRDISGCKQFFDL